MVYRESERARRSGNRARAPELGGNQSPGERSLARTASPGNWGAIICRPTHLEPCGIRNHLPGLCGKTKVISELSSIIRPRCRHPYMLYSAVHEYAAFSPKAQLLVKRYYRSLGVQDQA